MGMGIGGVGQIKTRGQKWAAIIVGGILLACIISIILEQF